MMSQMTGGGASSELGMDAMDMIQDMPLTVILRFFGSALPVLPEQVVDGLLAQIDG